MDEKTEKLQTNLRIAAAFLKAHEEVKAQQAERKKANDGAGTYCS